MASGDTLVCWEAAEYTPPPANAATPDIRNGHRVLDFDADVNETAYFHGVMPRHYAGGSILIRLVWMGTVATAGDVVWSVLFERHDPATDLDADSWGGAQWQLSTAPSVSGAPAYIGNTFNPSLLDGIVGGDHFRLFVQRVANYGLDTMTGDAELLSVELREA